MKRYPMVAGMRQDHDAYTAEDYLVWKTLFERQMPLLQQVVAPEYLEGVAAIGFRADEIPRFEDVDKALMAATGWSLVVVPGIIAEADFFQLLAQRRFPATTWLRTMPQLDYLPEPDMFHDVFGHVPLLMHPHFTGFFQALGQIGLEQSARPEVVEMLGRLYWFTVEFGLIRTQGQTKIYGAGIVSSHGETKFSLSDVPAHLPFDVRTVMHTPYLNDRIQDKYFVIESFEQLVGLVDEIRSVVAEQA